MHVGRASPWRCIAHPSGVVALCFVAERQLFGELLVGLNRLGFGSHNRNFRISWRASPTCGFGLNFHNRHGFHVLTSDGRATFLVFLFGAPN